MKIFNAVSAKLNLMFFVLNSMLAGVALARGNYEAFVFNAAIGLLNGLVFFYMRTNKNESNGN